MIPTNNLEEDLLGDKQFEKDPTYHCYSCGRIGTTTGKGGERIRTCERCGLRFCKYCGTLDEYTMTFMCNNCWKYRAKFLEESGDYDEAISILERIQDYEEIEEVVKKKEKIPEEIPQRDVGLQRIIVLHDRKMYLGWKVGGERITDVTLMGAKKRDVIQKFGWDLAPVLWMIRNVMKTERFPIGNYRFDSKSGRVSFKGLEKKQEHIRYKVFERIKVRRYDSYDWGTLIDGYPIIDSDFASMSKKQLINVYGWDFATLLLKIIKASIKTPGLFVMDMDKKSITKVKR